MTNNSAYSILAKFYDELMSDFDYQKMHAFILNKIEGKCGLDLGCGSGTISIMLAKQGYNIIAVDSSVYMLDVASKKARANNLDILFLNQNIAELDLNKKFDFVTAVCDIFNYLDSNELQSAISRVYNNLEKNGKLIFDISSKNKLINILGDNLYFEDKEDITYLWQNELNEKEHCVDMDLIFFEKQQNESYLRNEEYQRQYYYTQEEIKDFLKKFSNVKFYDGETFGKYNIKSNRLLVVATK